MFSKLFTSLILYLNLLQSILAFESGFTIIIATYQRDHLLPSLLSHLITKPSPSLKSIILIWQNINTPLPSFLQPKALIKLTSSNPTLTISVRLSPKNSMNERFRPDPNIILTESVFIMDDDIVLTNSVLEWGYQEYLLYNPLGSDPGDGRIVGFTPREFKEIPSTSSSTINIGEGGGGSREFEYLINSKKSYSMILSNAAWIRREWMDLYWLESQEMIGLRKIVDDVFNCDDILLNFLVSNYTQLPPLLLQPTLPLRTILTPGLWNRTSPILPPHATITNAPLTAPPPPELNHFETRPKCLNYYFQHFKRFNPDPDYWIYFPLLSIRSSISQDLIDYSRNLNQGESWDSLDGENDDGEDDIWVEYLGDQSRGSSDEFIRELEEDLNLTQEEVEDQKAWDERLSKMSDEEVKELMIQLEEDMRNEDLEEIEYQSQTNQTRLRDEL